MRGPGPKDRPRALAPTLGILFLLVGSGLLVPVPAGAVASAPIHGGGLDPLTVAKIHDLTSNSHAFGSGTSWLFDNVTTPPTPSKVRSYALTIRTTWANATQPVLLITEPTSFWADPNQFPYGADSLPPLSEWAWWVQSKHGHNDTANWTVDPSGTYLQRTGTWTNQSYVVFGISQPTIDVNVTPALPDGSHATGGGVVMNAPGNPYSLPTTSTYSAMGAALAPSLIRFGLDTAGTLVGWNANTGQPMMSYTGLDKLFGFANSSGASVLLSLPAGNWGDGNSVPSGTPLNTAVPEVFHNLSGYFLAPRAMYAIVRQIANHTNANHETVAYWSVGNEPPINSTAIAGAFARDVNAAISAVRVGAPGGRVGADNMMSFAYLSYFANATPNIGFLSFHWYQSVGLCETPSGAYCPPAGSGNGAPLSSLFSHPAYGVLSSQYAPVEGQWAWYNLTGHWIPVLNTETNIGARGGPGSPTQNFGTDPRIPDLMGAAWLGSLLVDSSRQNLSALTYFTLTSASNDSYTTTYADGGFGFGLTNVTSTGHVTEFAPYYVMELWDAYLPAGSRGLNVTSTDPGSVRAYAVIANGHVNVALVSRVGVPLTVKLAVAGHFTLHQVTSISSDSYEEQYNATANRTVILRSGVNQLYSSTSNVVSFPGYGFAVAQFVPSGVTGEGAGNGTNGSGGDNGTSGSGGQSGNGTGDGSGNSSGGSGGGNASSGGSGGGSGGSSNSSGTSSPPPPIFPPTAPVGAAPVTTEPTAVPVVDGSSHARTQGLPEISLAALGLLVAMLAIAVYAGRSARRPPPRRR